MSPTKIEIIATAFFAIAIAHTFLSSAFQHLAAKFPEGSVGENILHMLGEVEVVFGLWAAVFLAVMTFVAGPSESIRYAESLTFTEPLFVFAIMVIAATKPIIDCVRRAIFLFARLLPINRDLAQFVTCLVVGPILGSFITEPAAMTVTALVLRDRYFRSKISDKFRYTALAVLFVNVSIGGVLTHFAAPPVLMVAAKWNWNIGFMMQTFGWKAVIAIVINAVWATWLLRKEIVGVGPAQPMTVLSSNLWLTAIHLTFLALVVVTAHHPVIFIGLFLLFLGVASVTKEFQDDLLLKQSLLVSLFLGGLVVIGGFQSWWLRPALTSLSDTTLFFGAAALTAMADNAALTYLGSQLENVSASFQYALVAGAVAGGGLTVIANAPNPAGYAILQESFGSDGISPIRLLFAALRPTLVALGTFGVFWM